MAILDFKVIEEILHLASNPSTSINDFQSELIKQHAKLLAIAKPQTEEAKQTFLRIIWSHNEIAKRKKFSKEVADRYYKILLTMASISTIDWWNRLDIFRQVNGK